MRTNTVCQSHAKLGLVGLCALGAAVAAASQSASAQLIFTGSSGSLAGQATFSISGSSLVVQLTNTSSSDVLVPADVLTAIFFDINLGAPTLTRSQAIMDAGSSVYYDPDGQPAGGIVGGEWAYNSGLVGAPGDRSYGISSAGFGLFGAGDRFPGPDLAPPPSPDGVQYGLLSAGDDVVTGNGGITGSGGLIKYSVTFTLDGLGADFDLNRIQNVFFQYGTALDEPGYEGATPSPGAGSVLALAGLVAARRRRS